MIWSQQFDIGINDGPVLGHDGTIYLADGYYSSYLHALNQDGELLWTRDLDTLQAKNAPAVGENGIYLGSYGGKFFKLDFDGEIEWIKNVDHPILSIAALGLNNSVIINTMGGELYCFDQITGDLNWEISTPETERTSPVVDVEGNIYLGDRSGSVHCYTASGDILWEYFIGDATRGFYCKSPAISNDGTLYIGTTNSNDGTPGLLIAFQDE